MLGDAVRPEPSECNRSAMISQYFMELLPFSSADEFPTPHNLSACFSGLNDRQAHGQYHKTLCPSTVMTCGSRILRACAVLTLNGNFCVVQPNTVCRISHHLSPTGISALTVPRSGERSDPPCQGA